MMVNYPLSRGLGNIAKVYLIKCSHYVYSMHIAYVYIKNYILIIAFLAKVKFELKLD